MDFYPPITLSFLNGFLLTLGMMVLRFGIPGLMNKESLAELAYFPPVQGLERSALKVYFISNSFLIFSPLLAKINFGTLLTRTAWIVYLAGMIILLISLIQYSREDGLKQQGIFSYSRNPLCVGYFLVYLATSLVIGSWFHLFLTLIYQAAVHALVLSEERWCIEKFGEYFQIYQQRTPRYLLFKGKS